MLLTPQLNTALGEIVQGRVKTDDGAELLYQSFGEGDRAIVLANGIGVRYPGFVRQIAALRGRLRVVCWDYRGIGQSVLPPGGDLTMPRHGRDLLAVLDRLGVERATLLGWSMGVQVCLEAIRLAPARAEGFIALLGTAGRPFERAMAPLLAQGTSSLFGLAERYPQLMQQTLAAAVALPRLTFGLLSTVSFVGADADREVFAANVRSVAGVDKQIYARTMLAMAEHDASDVLTQVPCPALVIAGERDYLTPPRVAQEMARLMRDARYRELIGGTHFGLIEQVDRVNDWIAELVEEVAVRASGRAAGREASG